MELVYILMIIFIIGFTCALKGALDMKPSLLGTGLILMICVVVLALISATEVDKLKNGDYKATALVLSEGIQEVESTEKDVIDTIITDLELKDFKITDYNIEQVTSSKATYCLTATYMAKDKQLGFYTFEKDMSFYINLKTDKVGLTLEELLSN